MVALKLLFLSHPEVDYGSYFLYNGLCQILGVENVVDFPYKLVHHGEVYDGPIPWYGEGKTGRAAPPPFFKAWGGNRHSFNEIVDMIDEFDFIVLASPRWVAVNSMRRLKDELGLALPPVIMVDGEDYAAVDADLMREFDVQLCFKRELNVGVKRPWIHPFPFSSYIPDDSRFDFPDEEKELDVFFVAGKTYPSRVGVVLRLNEICREKGYRALVALDRDVGSESLRGNADMYVGANFSRARRLTHEDYLRHIAKAKIGVSVRGWGVGTIRFFEVPSYNTLLLSDDIYGEYRRVHPYPFTDRKNAVFFKSDCRNLEELLIYYLENDDEREKVAKAGHQYLIEHHINKKRAEYFLEIVTKYLNDESIRKSDYGLV